MEPTPTLHILLVEDDEENLELLRETLPEELSGFRLEWEPCASFDEALRRVDRHRYDLVVTDVYRDRDSVHKNVAEGDVQASRIIEQLINRRFCPVVIFTDGSMPPNVKLGPFVRGADKSVGNGQIVARLEELIETGVPTVARTIHEEIDRVTGSYLWGFLAEHWERLTGSGLNARDVLERVLRRRAAIQLARVTPEGGEVGVVEAAEFYVYPSIAGDEYRLGEVVWHNTTGEFRVVLTPHCHLTVQQGATEPKTEFVLTVKALEAGEAIRLAHTKPDGTAEDPWTGKISKLPEKVRRRINSPADLMGSPDGRYWFLPGFLDIPDLYCDLLQLESVPFAALRDEYERLAVLDTPFAEALQSCFTRFYSSVGLPSLDPARFEHLTQLPKPKGISEGAPGAGAPAPTEGS